MDPQKRREPIPRAGVLGVQIALVTRARLTQFTLDALEAPETTIVFAIHLVGVNLLGVDRAYERALGEADLVHADGTSVMLAARAAGHRLPERIATQDFMYDVVAHAEAHEHSLFLLGGAPGLAAKAAGELRRRYPGLAIAGTHDGFFNDADGRRVAEEIRASGAHLLLVGMGCPREQIWSAEHGRDTGVRVLMTVGGTFGYIVGEESRAPRWVQRSGLEWFWRMAQDPRRLTKRYLGGIPRLARQIAAARRGRA